MNKLFLFLVFLVFFTTPLESVEIFTNVSVVKLVSVALILVTLLAKKNVFDIKEPFLIIFLIYTVFTILSFLWSINKEVTFQKSLTTILPNFIVTLIVSFAIKDREILGKMFMAYVLGCCVAAAFSMYMYTTEFQSFEGDDYRVTVLNQDQNELSFLLFFGIVSIIYLFKYSVINKIAKGVLLLVPVIFAFVILTTGSRMGLILLLMLAVVLVFMNFRRGKIIIVIPLILVIGIVFVSLLPDTTTERLFQIQDQIKSRDLTGRVTIWSLGLSAFETKSAYVLGTGYDSFESLVAEKTGLALPAHNTYLCTFIETGAVGFLIYLSMIIYLLFKVYYLIRKGSVFFSLLIIPLLATMFVLSTNNRRWFFLIGVIIIKLWQFAKEEESYAQVITDN